MTHTAQNMYTQGWGLELQGSFNYQFASCYSDFDWCSETTTSTNSKWWHCRDGETYSGARPRNEQP